MSNTATLPDRNKDTEIFATLSSQRITSVNQVIAGIRWYNLGHKSLSYLESLIFFILMWGFIAYEQNYYTSVLSVIVHTNVLLCSFVAIWFFRFLSLLFIIPKGVTEKTFFENPIRTLIGGHIIGMLPFDEEGVSDMISDSWITMETGTPMKEKLVIRLLARKRSD